MLSKLLTRFGNTKLHIKLLLSYGIVVLLPVLLIGYFLITRNTAIALDQMNSLNEINFRQIKSNIGNKLSEYVQTTDSFSAESQLMNYFNGKYSNYEDGEKYLAYSNIDLIYRTKFDTVELRGADLNFYTNNTGIMEGYYIHAIDSDVEKQKWYNQTMNARGTNSICDPYKNKSDQIVIPVSKILNFNSSDFTSIINLEIPQNDLYSLIVNEGANKDIYILNNNNCIISSTDKSMVAKYSGDIKYVENFMLTGLGKTKSYKIQNGERMIYCDSIKIPKAYGEFKIIEIVSTSEMLKKIAENVNSSILICIISVIITMILVMIFSNTLTRRLKFLVRNMAKIRDGSFEVFVDCNQTDEIGELSISFKSMVERINHLVKEVYEADINIKNLEIKRKEAELHALHSQINPHFLFNTMESIRMNLLKNGETIASEVIKNFAMLLRKSINWSEDNISIKQEIELTDAYLKIQKFRYKEKLSYEINFDDNLKEYMIPKFSIQPLVENAIYHGIEMKEGQGLLTIDCIELDEDIRIIINDNGVGIDKEKMSELENILNNSEDSSNTNMESQYKSIGIQNVNQRLKLNFGMKYGLKINSIKGKRTIVEILMPKIKNMKSAKTEEI